MYTPDLAVLLFPVVERMIFSIGKKAEVKNLVLTKPKKDNTKELINRLLKSRNIDEDRLAVLEKEKSRREEKKEEDLEDIQKGLMSPNKEIENEEDED